MNVPSYGPAPAVVSDAESDAESDAVATLRKQLLQLRASHAAGTLDAATHDALRAPLERSLVDAVLDAQAAPLPPVPSVSPVSPAMPAHVASTPLPASPGASRPVWAGALAFITLVALAGYLWTGSPGAVGQPPDGFVQGGAPDAAAAAPADGSGPGAGTAPVTREQIDSMVKRLAEHLKAQPGDTDGWVMLGRSYMALDQPAEAVAAYRTAIEQRPNDAGLLADAADAMAAGSPTGLEGEPMRLIDRALQIDATNLKALALAGSAAFNRGDYAGAAERWDRVVATGPAESKLVELARGGAAEARQRAGAGAGAGAGVGAGAGAGAGADPRAAASTAAAVPAPPAASSAASITGTVRLSPTLVSLAAPGDTVFIYARAAEGGRMPLAIVRRQVGDLPFDFVLDDSSAMSPATRLSGAGRVVVSARISKSGQATPQSGDLEGVSMPVAVGARDLALEIGRRIP